MITHTISLFEVLWTLIALIGLLLTLATTRTVMRDLEVLRQQPDYIVMGPREIIARGRIRTETIKLIIMLGYVLAGIAAMSVPSPKNNPYNAASIVAALVLVTASVLMVYDTYQYLQDREYFIRTWRGLNLHTHDH